MFLFSLGEQILGWEIGMGSMKKGETARFLISPAYAYGRMGCPPRIPADSSGWLIGLAGVIYTI